MGAGIAHNSDDSLYPRKSFPLQQGDLDSLCLPYAVLNALNRTGQLNCVYDAEQRLGRMIRAIQDDVDGNLAAAVMKGFDPVSKAGKISDVNWVARIIAGRNFLSDPIKVNVEADLQRLLEASISGCLVFFENAHDDEQSHYTFVLKSSCSGVFELWDSFGFQQLCIEGASAQADGRPINLKYAWQTR